MNQILTNITILFSIVVLILTVSEFYWGVSIVKNFYDSARVSQYSEEHRESNLYTVINKAAPTNRTNTICKEYIDPFNQRQSLWKVLCTSNFLPVYDKILVEGGDINIVQIGAHIGWEENDLLCSTMSKYLNMLSDAEKKRVHWTFVEPSPPNYKGLLENIAEHSQLCDMSSVNTAVIPDLYNVTGNMTFYQMDECIDVRTGYDSKSGKKLPAFLSQLSSFDKSGIQFNFGVFRRNGLNPLDYFHEISVSATRYSDLMKDLMKNEAKAPYLLLLDTQGMDCKIIQGISERSSYLPQYLIFEDNMCGAKQKSLTQIYLKYLGYNTTRVDAYNMFAQRMVNTLIE